MRAAAVPRMCDYAARAAPTRSATPEKVRALLSGDLEHVVRQAMHPDPERRYADAGALADDLARFLAHEPIRARPDTLAYRAERFMRRHAALLLVAAVAFALVSAALFYHAGTLRAERDRAVEARRRAEGITNFVVRVFQGADPTLARGDTMDVFTALDMGTAAVLQEPLLREYAPGVQVNLVSALAHVYGQVQVARGTPSIR